MERAVGTQASRPHKGLKDHHNLGTAHKEVYVWDYPTVAEARYYLGPTGYYIAALLALYGKDKKQVPPLYIASPRSAIFRSE